MLPQLAQLNDYTAERRSSAALPAPREVEMAPEPLAPRTAVIPPPEPPRVARPLRTS